MFANCITWLQEQAKVNAYNLSLLHDLRELAAKKRLSNITQKHLIDYFQA